MARSLRASREGIAKAKKAFQLKGWTQEYLAGSVGCTRQVIGKFFAERSVESRFFTGICAELGLEWGEIAELEPGESKQDKGIDVDALVQEVREKVKTSIQERCGTMRVLDMTQPIGLNNIYTSVNILEQITGRRRKEITELLQGCNPENFDRFGLSDVREERLPGLEAVEKYSKLMILGKPGAGKTTFLKYVALQCNGGKFQGAHVPIFVTLKDFAEATNKPNLLEYISQYFSGCSVTNTKINDLFNQGRALVLLDGLDEVRKEDSRRILKEIRDFSDQFSHNHFVITCRIAAREYTFEMFTEVEVADFHDEQISTFATNWFIDKSVKPATFIKRLEDNNRIKQIAASPLLLTLLCLVFEESGDFPANHSELYKEGLDALLKKWDAKRGIERDQVYKKLSTQRKEDLLSKIALTTFVQKDYFFKQKVAERYITNYIRNLPDANNNSEALQVDSEVVLRSIEYQHGLLVERAKGIYSFSHLTFHEYFTAREIILGTQPLEEALQNLVSHITEKSWREVFLLAVGMSSSADRLLLLMKQQVDAIVADEKLQQFLMWMSEKSTLLQGDYKPAAVRAFYLDIDIQLDPDRTLGCVLDFPFTRAFTCASLLARALNLEPSRAFLDIALELDFSLARYRALEPALAIALDRALAIDHYLRHDLERGESKLGQALQLLNKQLPDRDGSEEILGNWWKANGQAWGDQLRAVIIPHRSLGENWQFSEFSNQQKEVLRQYYDANLLLVACLNSDCYVSREVRSQIEDTLLLPIAEIEQRR